jgi:hypothetical protein
MEEVGSVKIEGRTPDGALAGAVMRFNRQSRTFRPLIIVIIDEKDEWGHSGYDANEQKKAAGDTELTRVAVVTVGSVKALAAGWKGPDACMKIVVDGRSIWENIDGTVGLPISGFDVFPGNPPF